MRPLPFHPALEGLRGLAVLLVLLFHGGVSGFGGGFLGVSTFFTLSGFLITGLLVHEREQRGRIALGRFWGRRFRRLMPAALLGLAATAWLGASLGDPFQLGRLRMDGLAALFYGANWWLIISGAAYADLMGSPSWLQHFWSLAIEEQYYAVVPGLAALLLLGGTRRPLAVVLAVGTVASWWWMAEMGASHRPTARIYYGTDARAGELLVGGLLAVAVTGRSPRLGLSRIAPVLGVLGALVGAIYWIVATVESAWLYGGGLALYSLSSLALLIGCLAPTGPVRVGLSTAPMRWLGRVSYGAYVYHWPLFLALDAERTGLCEWALLPLRIISTLAIATISYVFLEEPIRTGRGLRSWRAWIAASAVATGVFALYQTIRAEAELPEIPHRVAALVENAPRVAIVGDSLADNVGLGLETWSHRTGQIHFRNLSLPGCGFARGAWPEAVERRRQVCDSWPDVVKPQLRAFRPQLVIAVTAGWDLRKRKLPDWPEPREMGDPVFDDWLVEEYGAAVKVLSHPDAVVLWLTTPCMGGRFAKYENTAWVTHMNGAILPRVLAREERVFDVLDLFGAVCPGGKFVNRLLDIRPFRPDGIHFSPYGQRWVGEWLAPLVLDRWSRYAAVRELGRAP